MREGPINLRPTMMAASLLLAGAIPPEPKVQPPPFMDGLFPCTGCHDEKAQKTNLRQRLLEDMHDNILLDHLGASAWCFTCHDPRSRNQLHLGNGERVDFTVSYRLCAQCHDAETQAWRTGRHPSTPRTQGGQEALPLCVRCHNPHSPRMKTIKPATP